MNNRSKVRVRFNYKLTLEIGMGEEQKLRASEEWIISRSMK